jgi:predicted transcriptional regulator
VKATLFLALFLIYTHSHFAKQLSIGDKLPPTQLAKESGGRLDGSPWNLSDTIAQKKVTVIFYVDPDVKDRNEAISEQLSKRNFSKDKVQYLAIINMAATWLPNFAIASSLKKKQRKYPNTLYLKDFTKHIVKTWMIPDDENNIMILDQEGKLIYSHFGAVKKDNISSVIKLIEENIK